MSNIRLWRPSTLEKNFAVFQRVREYYDFLDVDVDRYPLGPGGTPRVIMVSAREMNQAGIPTAAQTWQNTHLAYTHGFGAVAAQVNTATIQGQPVLTLKDLPPTGVPTMTQPRIYYGESDQGNFVIAGANGELDYDGCRPTSLYSGQGGIPVDNLLRRALFAWNFRDINLLLSNQITDSSRLMIYRNIEQRAAKAVPFLTFDSDPYLSIVDGRPVWILDAYTTSDGYPYSQAVSGTVATDGLLGGTFNYMRNSVKVVIDAYDGTVTYYADLTEPIIQVWAKAYPTLFTPIAEAPAELLGTLPVPGEPVPGAGLPVRELPRDGPGGLLPAARLLADLARPDARVRREWDAAADAPVLPADQGPGGEDGGVPARDPVRARGPSEHGRLDGGVLRPGGLRTHHDVPVPGGAEHRGAAPGVRADQQRPCVLVVPHARRSAGVDAVVRRLPRDPDRRLVPVRVAGVRAGERGFGRSRS